MRVRKKRDGIRKKLLRKYFYTIIVCFWAGMAIISLWARNAIYNSILETSMQEFMQINNAVENRISQYYYVSYMIQNSRIVIESMQKESGEETGKYYAKRNIEAQLAVLTGALSLYPITLYLDKGTLYQDNITFHSISELEDYPEFAAFRKSESSYIWLMPEKIRMTNLARPVEAFPFIRKIGENTDPIAFQKVCIRKEEIQDLIIPGGAKASVYLYSQDRDLLLVKEGADCFHDEEEKYLSEFSREWKGDSGWTVFQSRYGDYYVHAQLVKGTDWLMVMMIPKLFFLDGFLRIFATWIILFLVLILIYRRFDKRYTADIVDRIRHLQQEMGERLEDRVEDPGEGIIGDRDELDVLEDYYKDMLGRMQALHDSRIADERDKRKLELSLMQSQINPHFLYNTLDLINWKARNVNNEEISDIACKLADFYRLSLNQGKEIVRIRDEIEQARNYIDLQNYRFDMDIDLIIEIPEEMMNTQIPKITLQPLIENAVQHGFLVKEKREECEIEVYGWREEEGLILMVRDNGEGMPQEVLDGILLAHGSEQHGYGIRNIDERIRLYCGRDYGLRFESRLGEGTCVYVKFGGSLEETATE